MGRLRLPLVPRWLRWVGVLCVVVVIGYYSIVPPPIPGRLRTGPLGMFAVSTWLHFIAYGGFAVTLAYALADSPRPGWQLLVVVFGIAVGYGLLLELIQGLLPRRTMSGSDVFVNALGASVAVVGWRMLRRYVRFYRLKRAHIEAQLPEL